MSLSPLLRSLQSSDRAHPTAAKLLVGPTLLWGREALRAVARHSGGWTGWEAGTLKSLADELAFVSLSDAGVRPASDIEIGALVGSALDQSVSDRAVASTWNDLASHAGFRRAILDAVLELRAAGVGPDQIRQLDAAGPVHHLAAVVERFAALLHRGPHGAPLLLGED